MFVEMHKKSKCRTGTENINLIKTNNDKMCPSCEYIIKCAIKLTQNKIKIKLRALKVKKESLKTH